MLFPGARDPAGKERADGNTKGSLRLDGRIGPITERLRTLYQNVVRGQVAKYKHWLTPVY